MGLDRRTVLKTMALSTGVIATPGLIHAAKTADRVAVKDGLMELYQGEVIGEGFFDAAMKHWRTPDQRFKLTAMMQLETETKARLRAEVLAMGLDPKEDDNERRKGIELADSLAKSSWLDMTKKLEEILHIFVARYITIADSAPSHMGALFYSMVTHEKSLLAFAELELAARTSESVDAVIAQLKYPPRMPQGKSA